MVFLQDLVIKEQNHTFDRLCTPYNIFQKTLYSNVATGLNQTDFQMMHLKITLEKTKLLYFFIDNCIEAI